MPVLVPPPKLRTGLPHLLRDTPLVFALPFEKKTGRKSLFIIINELVAVAAQPNGICYRAAID
jgi:hypothetical protein